MSAESIAEHVWPDDLLRYLKISDPFDLGQVSHSLFENVRMGCKELCRHTAPCGCGTSHTQARPSSCVAARKSDGDVGDHGGKEHLYTRTCQQQLKIDSAR